MADTGWKNTRSVIGEPSELTQVRLPIRLKREVIAIAKKPKNNSSLSAIVRAKLEEFVEEQHAAAPKAKTGVFD